jgi:hypothetical protein
MLLRSPYVIELSKSERGARCQAPRSQLRAVEMQLKVRSSGVLLQGLAAETVQNRESATRLVQLQKEGLTLLVGKLPRHDAPCVINQCLCRSEHTPDEHCAVE